MRVEIAPVPESQKPELWSMFQRYARELAPMANMKLADGEPVSYPHFDLYWQEKTRWPFWAVVEGERAGFALVRFAEELASMQMAEFFIAPEHRRGGTGLEFARRLLARYPGPWKIRQILANRNATAFWRRVAEPYGYTEEQFIAGGVDRIEQTLTVPAPSN